MLALCACQNDARFVGIDKPEPPNIQPLLDAFAIPTAAIAPEALAGLTPSISERTSIIDTLQVDQLLVRAVSDGLSQLQQSGQATAQAIQSNQLEVARQPISVQGDGYMVVTRICDGWGPTPVPDPANGTLELTAGFTEQGLDPVVWGSLFACKYKLGVRSIQLDGLDADPLAIDVRAYIGRAVTFQSFGQVGEPIVVDIAARVFVDGVEQLGRVSFKIDPITRRFETLVPLGSGYVIVGVPLDRTSAVEVRASNGTFLCDVAAQRCTTANGQTIGAP